MSMRWPTFLDGPEISISGGCESRFFVTLSWLTGPKLSRSMPSYVHGGLCAGLCMYNLGESNAGFGKLPHGGKS